MPDLEPDQAPVDEMYESEPLGDDGRRVDQENVAGKDNLRGGGEYPDAHTPPDEDAGAPGELRSSRPPGQSQFQEAWDEEQAETPPT
jgi:hypothetical protein